MPLRLCVKALEIAGDQDPDSALQWLFEHGRMYLPGVALGDSESSLSLDEELETEVLATGSGPARSANSVVASRFPHLAEQIRRSALEVLGDDPAAALEEMDQLVSNETWFPDEPVS